MAYIDPLVSTELTLLSSNPSLESQDFNGGSALSFKTRNWLKKAREAIGPANGAAPGFKFLTSAQQTAIIAKARALATS